MAELTLAMEREPYTDLLGDPFLELEGRSVKKGRGKFHTPQNICDMMAEMTTQGSLEDGKILTLSDPACSSGRMVLGLVKVLEPSSAPNRFGARSQGGEKRGLSPLCVQATVQDLNPTAVDMAYINLTLWGVPTKAIVLGKAAPPGPARLRRYHSARGKKSLLQSFLEQGPALSDR